ncbi:hypothetical protein, variant [Cryptococcus amylolentus CBS 6039]|uniref:PUM-HD domain-containing protein n=1 Tax=Cryptococcus amylolentus CBS 6039 TaxID=1295533 RepID=A0A1E3HYY6_9TREE|nr:hypothetical protein, variant [Cryptococcus amylolentus CBS 6039]ODN81562.1 hypothetical protein, variant [Cryptococcus amylolentus CBS 6039]
MSCLFNLHLHLLSIPMAVLSPQRTATAPAGLFPGQHISPYPPPLVRTASQPPLPTRKSLGKDSTPVDKAPSDLKMVDRPSSEGTLTQTHSPLDDIDLSIGVTALRPIATPFLPGVDQELWGPPTRPMTATDLTAPIPSRSRLLPFKVDDKPQPSKDVELCPPSSSSYVRRMDKCCHANIKPLSSLEQELAETKLELDKSRNKASALEKDNQRLIDIMHHIVKSSSSSLTPHSSPPSSQSDFSPLAHPSSHSAITPPTSERSVAYEPIAKPNLQAPPAHTQVVSAMGAVGVVPSPAVSSQLMKDVLTSKMSFDMMDPEMVLPVVSVIATHHMPTESNDFAGLKKAVDALSEKLVLSNQAYVGAITRSIIEFAPRLCTSHWGNHLCRRLLELGSSMDRLNFLRSIVHDIITISNNIYGIHVLMRIMAYDDLAEVVGQALLQIGLYDVLRNGSRRLWQIYIVQYKQDNCWPIYKRIIEMLNGRWVDLACTNEDGAIAIQHLLDAPNSQDLVKYCWREMMNRISTVANNPYGCNLISKFLAMPSLFRATCGAILFAYPPVATTHHGITFVNTALARGVGVDFVRYVECLCVVKEGKRPGILAVAESDLGKGHLLYLLSRLTSPDDALRIRHACQKWSHVLQGSPSGSELLIYLGIVPPNTVFTPRPPSQL